MKFTKIASAFLIGATLVASMPSVAGSIGRSGGGSFSRSSSSFSRPSTPAPRPAPSVAPTAPPKQGGIGGTTGSMGVRKSDVTNQVAANKAAQAPVGRPNAATTPSYGSTPAPTYGTVPAPVYQAAPAAGGVTNGSTFLSSMGGSFVGSSLANMLTGSHGSHGGTTVINNGGGGGTTAGAVGAGAVAPSALAADGSIAPGVYPMGAAPVAKSSYGIGSFIMDVILFVILVALLVGVAWLFYKGFKMIRAYVNRERGVGPTQPFSPTSKFWEIQKAFAAGDLAALTPLLGPDLVDEATRDLQPSTLTLHGVSHEVVLNNPREFSVHYTFTDGDEVVDQVWHYELHDKVWKLNGIETV